MTTSRVEIYDTTLRDGTQQEGISLTAGDKLEVAGLLDQLGIAYIEGGWPGSNPKDMQFFDLAKRVEFRQARLVAFGSTRKPGIQPADDDNLKALIASKTPTVAIFGKSWDLHVREVMNNSLTENLAMIRDSVAFLKNNDLEVVYDAEHFFDGYIDDPRKGRQSTRLRCRRQRSPPPATFHPARKQMQQGGGKRSKRISPLP